MVPSGWNPLPKTPQAIYRESSNRKSRPSAQGVHLLGRFFPDKSYRQGLTTETLGCYKRSAISETAIGRAGTSMKLTEMSPFSFKPNPWMIPKHKRKLPRWSMAGLARETTGQWSAKRRPKGDF
jgi:hypothetical protein